jgi:hypothetical protein
LILPRTLTISCVISHNLRKRARKRSSNSFWPGKLMRLREHMHGSHVNECGTLWKWKTLRSHNVLHSKQKAEDESQWQTRKKLKHTCWPWNKRWQYIAGRWPRWKLGSVAPAGVGVLRSWLGTSKIFFLRSTVMESAWHCKHSAKDYLL